MPKYYKLFFLIVPLISICFCKENSLNKLTIANLKAAVKGELRSYKKYSDYARKAREEGHQNLGFLFDSISGIEKQHAEYYLETLEKYGIQMDTFEMIDFQLYPVGSSLDNLRYSIKNDNRDLYKTYDKFAKTARDEKMFDVAETFSEISNMESMNIRLLQNLFITFKPVGKNKKATISHTKRVNF